MTDRTKISLESIDKRLSTIETFLMRLVQAMETETTGKALTEQIAEVKKDLACLEDERTIFKK